MAIRVERELARFKPAKDTVLTIGVFDGVHLGHQYLLRHLLLEARERDLIGGVVTFDRHPQTLFLPESPLMLLNTLEDRVELLRNLGIELICVLPFTRELAKMGAPDFVRLLKTHLRMSRLLIGPDFVLGKGREGNIALLHSLGEKTGFTVEAIPPMTIDGVAVSSTAIREYLGQGNMGMVEKLLGRPFRLTGQVVTGSGRGRKLGFPTANLDVRNDQALPGDGVYATVAYLNHKRLPSVTNVGVRPTFGGGRRFIEVHIMNYRGHQLYGNKMRLDFVKRIRDERRFASEEELKAQIEKDIELAGELLATKAAA